MLQLLLQLLLLSSQTLLLLVFVVFQMVANFCCFCGRFSAATAAVFEFSYHDGDGAGDGNGNYERLSWYVEMLLQFLLLPLLLLHFVMPCLLH